MPEASGPHTLRAVRFARAPLQLAFHRWQQLRPEELTHTHPRPPRLGAQVNVAARMESNSLPGRVNMSSDMHAALIRQAKPVNNDNSIVIVMLCEM